MAILVRPTATSKIYNWTVTSERHAWQVEQDIVLKNNEIVLFRFFAEKASLWVCPNKSSLFIGALRLTPSQLDLFDPFKHFGTYAVRLAVSLTCPPLWMSAERLLSPRSYGTWDS